MQLGKKSKTTDMFERVRGEMGAEVEESASSPLVPNNPVHVEHTPADHGLSNENTSQSWTFSTNRSTTWLNISITGLEEGDILSVGVSDGVWYHHEMLGDENADRFSCRQTQEGGFEEYNVCTESQVHSMTAEQAGNMTIRGIVSPELPMGGLGSLYADSLQEAENASANLIATHNGTRVWTITLDSMDTIHPAEFSPHVQSTSHELLNVESFEIDPMTEDDLSEASDVENPEEPDGFDYLEGPLRTRDMTMIEDVHNSKASSATLRSTRRAIAGRISAAD